MSEVFNPNEQALVAVLNEAKDLGVDLAKLAEKVNAGIMGNKSYTWVNANNKPSVIAALDSAIKSTE